MIFKEELWFSPARENRRLHIYLPDEYDHSDERYPVMYMFDGHNLYFDADATYGTSWGFKEFLDTWEKRMIVVGVECSHHGNDRLSEYCPYDFSSNWAGNVRGTGEDTMRWMIDVVKPHVDGNLRTWPHREATGIGGASMGGLMALYAVGAHNDVYSKGACVSSSIGFCSPQMRHLLETAPISPDTKAFLSWGENEAGNARGRAIMRSVNKAADKRLVARGAKSYMYCQPSGRHCEADWRRQVPMFMNWLWRDVI